MFIHDTRTKIKLPAVHDLKFNTGKNIKACAVREMLNFYFYRTVNPVIVLFRACAFRTSSNRGVELDGDVKTVMFDGEREFHVLRRCFCSFFFLLFILFSIVHAFG